VCERDKTESLRENQKEAELCYTLFPSSHKTQSDINGPVGDILSYSLDAVIHGGGGMSVLPFVSETFCLCFDVSVEFCPLPSPVTSNVIRNYAERPRIYNQAITIIVCPFS
jgi:hypothetical protein